jgi:3-dehydroquinate dehydratase-1
MGEKMVSIGNCELGKTPRVVAIIDEFFSAEKVLEMKVTGVDLFEMRIDCLSPPLDKIVTYLDSVWTIASLPMIGTVRENDWTRKDRVNIFRAIMPFVDSIDLELDTPISGEVRSFAEDKIVVISEHDFTKTPKDSELKDIVSRSIDQGADIAKLAVMANSADDVRRLFWFTQTCTTPIVTIAMGPLGSVSRVISPLFGSLFTYGFIEKPNAPGQLAAKKLVDEIDLYFPGK